MPYYVRHVANWPTQTWKIDDRSATLMGVSNPQQVPGGYFAAGPGETIWEAIRRGATAWFGPNGENPFCEITLGPGQYYPRIARPMSDNPAASPGFSRNLEHEADVIAIAQSQLATLIRELALICQTVHPARETFATFGHDIRNLLILACTEVEAHWRGVLVKNNVAKNHFNTRHYRALRAAMRLDEYALRFPMYPWLDPVAPFAGWARAGRLNHGLKWYSAYNAVKHDRENEFKRGDLQSVFEAIAAIAIMLVAQFGMEAILKQEWDLGTFFEFAALPAWPLKDVYLSRDMPGAGWSAVFYPFSF